MFSKFSTATTRLECRWQWYKIGPCSHTELWRCSHPREGWHSPLSPTLHNCRSTIHLRLWCSLPSLSLFDCGVFNCSCEHIETLGLLPLGFDVTHTAGIGGGVQHWRPSIGQVWSNLEQSSASVRLLVYSYWIFFNWLNAKSRVTYFSLYYDVVISNETRFFKALQIPSLKVAHV